MCDWEGRGLGAALDASPRLRPRLRHPRNAEGPPFRRRCRRAGLKRVNPRYHLRLPGSRGPGLVDYPRPSLASPAPRRQRVAWGDGDGRRVPRDDGRTRRSLLRMRVEPPLPRASGAYSGPKGPAPFCLVRGSRGVFGRRAARASQRPAALCECASAVLVLGQRLWRCCAIAGRLASRPPAVKSESRQRRHPQGNRRGTAGGGCLSMPGPARQTWKFRGGDSAAGSGPKEAPYHGASHTRHTPEGGPGNPCTAHGRPRAAERTRRSRAHPVPGFPGPPQTPDQGRDGFP